MASTKPSLFRKLLKRVLYLIYLMVAVLLLFEVIYRYQWFDFYSAEYEALNTDLVKNEEGQNVLIFGDSFSADPNGWVSHVREAYPDHNFYNAAIPGTGIRETLLIAPRRIEDTEPDLVIYQLYVGNDLFDIDRQTNWSSLSIARNLFWMISDDFLSLRYFNYKIGQATHFAKEEALDHDPKHLQAFDPNAYSPRENIYWKAEPGYFEKAIQLDESRAADFEALVEGIEELRAMLPEGCRLHLVVVPHATQVHERQFAQMKQVFSGFPTLLSETEVFHQNSYPFCAALQEQLNDDRTHVYSNLLLKLRLHSVKQPVYFANDPHLNAYGHCTMAHAVSEELQLLEGWPQQNEPSCLTLP